jgi:transposase InsO family protein
MVVMDQYTRRIIGFAVHANDVDGSTLCRMFNDATAGQGWPKYLSSDNDPLFQYHRWKANVRVLEIEEIKSLQHVPMSHPFVERLIGSIRRGYWIKPCSRLHGSGEQASRLSGLLQRASMPCWSGRRDSS